jgi:predicted metal-dependent phosphoesterase TrpH
LQLNGACTKFLPLLFPIELLIIMADINKIIFEKPDIDSLLETYTVFDLHFHTRYSDGRNSVEAIARRAKELRIGIALTDHNEIRGALEIEKYKGVLSIPGIEITSCEGTHILMYFYETESLKKFYRKCIKPFMGNDTMSSTKLTMEEIVDSAKLFKCIRIFPHPYSAAYTGLYNVNFSADRISCLLADADGVEVINAENVHRWNLQCALLGFNLAKAITGGSDGHSLYHMGKAVTYAACPHSREAFLDAVGSRQTGVIGKEINLIRKVAYNSAKLNVNIMNYPELLGKNIRYSYRLINTKSRLIKESLRSNLRRRKAKSRL